MIFEHTQFEFIERRKTGIAQCSRGHSSLISRISVFSIGSVRSLVKKFRSSTQFILLVLNCFVPPVQQRRKHWNVCLFDLARSHLEFLHNGCSKSKLQDICSSLQLQCHSILILSFLCSELL